MEQIFVSSVQKELQADRYAVRDFVHGNELLSQFFRVFLFEDVPVPKKQYTRRRTRHKPDMVQEKCEE